jgi:signal transduction histidine kinase
LIKNRITGLSGIIIIFLMLGFAVAPLKSVSSERNLMDSLVNKYERSDNPQIKFELLKKLSQLSFESGDYLSAIDYISKESETYLSSGDSLSWANTQYNLGMIYSILRSFDKANFHSSLALIYFERGGFRRESANAFINLGFIYNELREIETAIKYYERAESIFDSLSNLRDLEASYLNLGILRDKSMDYGPIREGFERSQRFTLQSNKVALIVIKTSLGKIYTSRNDILVAETYLSDALIYATEIGDNAYESIIRIGLGSVYFKKGKNKEALASLEAGLEIARQLKLTNVILDAYSELAGVSIKMGKSAVAFDYLNSYIKLKDSLYNEQYNEQLSRSNFKPGLGMRELQDERLLRQNLEQALEIERNNNSKIALVGVSLFVLMLLIVIFRKYYSKTRTFDNLEEKNKLIENQKSELENLILTKDRFLSIIAHDLKNPFTSLLGFADLAYNEFDEITDAEKRSYLNIIRISSQQIYSLLDNLLTWSRAQSGRIDFKPETISLSELVENSIDVVRSSAENKQITLFKDFTNEVNVKADKNMLFTVLRNLLTNAVKFTPNGGSVTVSCKCAGNKAEVIVSDTGIGMTQDEVSRLFKLDGNMKNSGTNNETGTGLGLILCQEFMNLHKSHIVAESIPGKGSKFSFTVDIVH